MQSCPLLNASFHWRKRGIDRCDATRAHGNRRRWLTVSTVLVGWLGWRALRDVLNAIPDSNDDFGWF